MGPLIDISTGEIIDPMQPVHDYIEAIESFTE